MNNFLFLFVIALCGTHISSLNVESTNRILGGTPAVENNLRYTISLQDKSQLSTNTRGHRCGGALVTLRHAVTSAMCVYVIQNGQFFVINATDYRVFAGSVLLTNDTSADRHRDIEKITVHPDYLPNTPFVNDIAVIALVSEFPSQAVSTVGLAVSDPTTIQGAVCQVSGWGSSNLTSAASTQLVQMTKTVYDQTPCRRVYSVPEPGEFQMNITDTMICAIDPLANSCLGDLGNPLVCNSNLNGILIFHRNDCSGTPIPFPEVYTRISSFRSWIQTTAGASTFQPGMAVLGLICIVQIVTSKVLQ